MYKTVPKQLVSHKRLKMLAQVAKLLNKIHLHQPHFESQKKKSVYKIMYLDGIDGSDTLHKSVFKFSTKTWLKLGM